MKVAPAPPRRPPLAPALQRCGLVVALAGALLKATVSISAFPGWELDPFELPSPPSGMGPAGVMFCDLAIILGSLGMLLARWLAGGRPRLVECALVAIGGVGIAVHSLGAGATIADQWVGSSWLAALVLGLGVSHAASSERLRAIIAAVFLGLVALLCLRGAQQVWIEHPATLADFNRNKEAIFAAQGWTPESPMAKAYSRRLEQPEASGWFGLANVYATFAAAGTVAAGVLCAGALAARRRRDATRPPATLLLGPLLALAAGAGATALAGAKGGVAAVVAGALAAAALYAVSGATLRARLGRLRRHAGSLITAGALPATFALVICRGLLADHLSEPSLLFRWFYMQAAVRIGAAHWLTGVGPDGFQPAYMLAKNPLSPEDVTSSHNMLLDWFATLGVAGLAWVAVWFLWLWRAGASPAKAPPPQDSGSATAAKADRWTLAGVGIVPALIATRLDQNVLSPDLAITRIAGLIVYCAVGWLVLAAWPRISPRWTRIALAAAAAAAGAHALIDVAGVWPGSAPVLALLMGLAGAPGDEHPAPHAPRAPLQAAACALLALVAAFLAWPRHVLPWERALRRAAAQAEVVGDLNQRWTIIRAHLDARQPSAIDEARELAAELRAHVGAEPRNFDEIAAALRDLNLRTSNRTATALADLAARLPQEWKLRREASRLKLREADWFRIAGNASGASQARMEAVRIADSAPESVHRSAAELAWLSLVREAAATKGAGGQDLLRSAAADLEAAARLAPYEPEYAKRLMRLYMRLNDHSRAAQWARKVLELDDHLKFEREVKALSPVDREEATRIASLP